MTDDKYLEDIYRAVAAVKGESNSVLDPQKSLIEDLGFESIDVLDLAFEVQNMTGIPIDLTKLILSRENISGRRFNDILIADIQRYLLENDQIGK